ncbi:cysteine-rich receptor-like protein kinase 6 isoform X5 [Hevea brasiliensis]|uniref:cysteine-rich receptor-like protein kinase 6 isoform X5 n=1 Tax=Hevea brasiliensis TaxID=3981 RepID=UPI0025D505C8|nr:cysteine-rich receptor-like protein kinase 6 isoform X5 [Hevea brasiliensis]
MNGADRRNETKDPSESSSSPEENRSLASASENYKDIGLRQYSYDQLAEATHRFSNNYLLGEGGFGQVYEGSLDGTTRAIKKLKNLVDEQSEENFEKEIMIISKLSHKNLVQLIGYCIEDANRLLVFEYFPNKSLRSKLHGREILDWQKRMKIAIGSARGLRYLHEECEPRIIHLDIKPDNILLDNEFEPKVADFGLALYFSDAATHVSKTTNKGTQVYADPMTTKVGKYSDKSDIYSFGVMLLELITGRKPMNERKSMDKSSDIIGWANPRIKKALTGEYTDFVDLKLSTFNYEEMHRMISCAKACINKSPNFRPSMKKVLLALEGNLPLENLCDEKNDNKWRWPRAAYEGVVRYTFEALANATDDFKINNRVGMGSSGEIYKGTLPNGKVVAIKKLRRHFDMDREEIAQLQFENEVKSFSRIRHRNIVKLVGYCGDKADRLLVYEFVSNNSLEVNLHGKVKNTIIWSIRMKIALGIAKGLAYLHEDCAPRLIHRDIKNSNIFLDDNFDPKIGDFGISKDFADYATHVSTEPRGTYGYAPPEYFKIGESRNLTDKSDVFSFGIVLLELITGKKACVKKKSKRYIYLAVWAMPLLKQILESDKQDLGTANCESLFDSKLYKKYNKDEMIRIIYCATACIYKPVKLRPQISKIVEVLKGNMEPKNIWVRNDNKYLYEGSPYAPLPYETSDS